MDWLRDLLAGVGLAKPRVLHVAEDRGSGPAVLLVHGIASTSVTFTNVVPLLQDGHRVVSVDILGHGESPAPANAEYTIDEHVQWLRRTVRRLRIRGDLVIVGHSLGALIVSRYARLHPRGLERVVLVSPPIYMEPDAIGDPIGRLATGAYLRVYEFMRTHKEFTMKRAALLARMLPIRGVLEVTEKNWPAFVNSLQNCIESQTTISDIAAIEAPVEIVYGTLDQFIVPGSMEFMRNMRNVRVRKVDLVDHLVRKRLAREVAAAVEGDAEIEDAGEPSQVDAEESAPPVI